MREWLKTAAGVVGFIGFVVRRTDFWKLLVGWRDKKITRETAVAEIARRYWEFVDILRALGSRPASLEIMDEGREIETSFVKRPRSMLVGAQQPSTRLWGLGVSTRGETEFNVFWLR